MLHPTPAKPRKLGRKPALVSSVNVIMDRDTGRPRGFGFVEMDEASTADAAMRALDGSNLGGRDLKVNEANERGRGGGGGGRDRY